MLRSIMVETGDSPCAVAAMETAVSLAKAFQARLWALTCLDERAVASGRIRRMLEEHTRQRQERFEEQCRAAGIECHSDIEVGDPHAAIVHLSRKADLMVLGSAPDPEAPDRGFASAGLAVARELVRHVLVVRHKAPAFRRIVVGYAGQENSCNALQLAGHLAEKAGGAVHVLCSGADIAEAKSLLNLAVAYLEAYKVEAVPHYVTQEPGDALFELVREVDADTVAIGAVRRSRLKMIAFGDTASRVLDGSPAAVLIGR